MSFLLFMLMMRSQTNIKFTDFVCISSYLANYKIYISNFAKNF
jgi:hypothetical protein